ncbi:MAG: F420-dependent oxidoreductase-like protein [Gammaproteobacteria bacterium]|jgi:F420-dependent oxidoreductase-like protein
MKMGLMIGYSGGKVQLPMELILEAEAAGFDSVWSAEAWGADAITPLAWILARTTKLKAGTAICQIPARTPSNMAMTAMTLDQLSGGRFILGVGPSGPQVVEGWYGNAYGKPLARSREYIEIIRKILAREKPLTHDGEHYQIPFNGPGSSGLGKPLKSILHGDPNLPIYTASFTPAGVTMAAEVADGFFPVWMNPERFDLFDEPIKAGFRKAASGKSLDNFDVAPFVRMSMGDDIAACRMKIKNGLALYIGGMGARNKNFYNDYAKMAGYEEAAIKIQDLFLAGAKDAAAEAVPDQLVDETALVGPPGHIREQLTLWKAAAARKQVGTMIVAVSNAQEARFLAEELL